MATAPRAVPKPAVKSAAPADVQPAEKKSGNKVLRILVVLVLLAAAGGAAWYFLAPQKAASSAAKKSLVPTGPPVFLVMEPFTVNLQPDDAGDQYLQVAFSLQVADTKELDNIKPYLPQVRSRLLLLLSGKKAAEISTVEGKQKLAGEILAQVKQPFVPGGASQNVINVFFTSFVIQ